MDDNTYCGTGNECPDSGGSSDCAYTDPLGATRSKFIAVGVYDRYYDTGTTTWKLQSDTINLDLLDERVILSGTLVGNSSLTGYGIVDQTYPSADISTDISAGKKGWMFHLLEEGERALGEFRIWGEVVYFLTFNPHADYTVDPCQYGTRSSNLYGVYYTSGTSPASPVFDLDSSATIDAGDIVQPGAGASIPGAIVKVEGPGFAGGSPIIRSFSGGALAINPLLKNEKIGQQTGSDSAVMSWREE